MNHSIDLIILITGILCLLVALLLILHDRRKTQRTMQTLEQMLCEAMNGTFTEHTFDESRLSSLETQFAHYLSASCVSAQNITTEKNRIKTLISDISHQSKTPVSNLLLYSELLLEEALPESARVNVEAIHSQSEKLRFLIDSLVKLSRLENGILTLSPKERPIQSMLFAVLSQYQSPASRKGLYLTLQDTDAYAVFDEKWTSEALCNIIDNAIKYTNHGGITVSVSAYELFTRIDISDTGVGISEEDQPKIFSRFYRAQSASCDEGVGIGLYLTREILHAQNGYIKVNSAPSRGSVFSVFLPRS